MTSPAAQYFLSGPHVAHGPQVGKPWSMGSWVPNQLKYWSTLQFSICLVALYVILSVKSFRSDSWFMKVREILNMYIFLPSLIYFMTHPPNLNGRPLWMMQLEHIGMQNFAELWCQDKNITESSQYLRYRLVSHIKYGLHYPQTQEKSRRRTSKQDF